jgi:hypothetical protein
MSEICWRTGVRIEGESEREREPEAGGLRVEAEGKISNVKVQSQNGEVHM